MASTIRLKRVYDPASENDGARILVDRLWPRGISKEKAHLTLWLKEVAPTNELRKWFNHDVARWQEFQQRYRAELDNNPDTVAQLVEQVKKGKTTLLYAAHDQEHNQAVVLEEYIARLL